MVETILASPLSSQIQLFKHTCTCRTVGYAFGKSLSHPPPPPPKKKDKSNLISLQEVTTKFDCHIAHFKSKIYTTTRLACSKPD